MKPLRNLSLATRILRLSGTVIVAFLLAAVWLFFEFRSSLYRARKVEIRNLVEASWHILEEQALLATSGIISEENAKRDALRLIGGQRFDQGNYFWIHDFNFRMVMHPLQPDLEGSNFSDYLDAGGKPLFREMNKIIHDQGAGYVEYLWVKPESRLPLKKISYVKEFPQWGWVIGTGFYLEDIDHLLV